MNFLHTSLRQVVSFGGLLLCLWLAAGCQTLDSTPPAPPDGAETNDSPALTIDHIRSGDRITVIFTDVPVPNPPSPYVVTLPEDGVVTLHLNLQFKAAGKRPADLEKEIYNAYVPKYYQRLTVSVRADERYFFVDGQVKSPGPKPYIGEMNILKAITAAAGFTDFANRKKVHVIRKGKKLTVNCIKAQSDPKENITIFPGDQIFVPQRFW
ncbi:MAG: SLBB domain-containing protein [Verrucomicrobia bacterium]|nr:SLBB domain-containing protein [Verrucomicrobiota bacterium]